MILKKLFALAFVLLAFQGFSQVFCDFETAATSPSRIFGEQAGIRDNPEKVNNMSGKVVYYNKSAGNWKSLTLEWDQKIPVKRNDVLSFQINASASGRVFVKIYHAGQLLKEDWAPRYDFRHTAGQWALAEFNIASLSGKEFDKIEIFGAVDNEAQAGIYLDNLKLSHSLSPDGSPVIILKPVKTKSLVGETVTFDASESFDPDGEIVSVTWSFGDGLPFTQGMKVQHTFNHNRTHPVTLIVVDNENKTQRKYIEVCVFDENQKVGHVRVGWLSYTGNSWQGEFLLRDEYKNNYDPDEVMVDAEIFFTDGSKITVPCFYYIKGYYANGQWVTDSTNQFWAFRFNNLPNKVGGGSVRVILKDKDGIIEPICGDGPGCGEFYMWQAGRENIIETDQENKQFFRRRATEKPYTPLGINVGWDSVEDYSTIFDNLVAGGANLVRYWVVPFNKQALEWKNDGYTHGLGKYSQAAAAFNDYLFEMAESRNLNLQMVLFQHGMFSENVNSNWADNPYNAALGGPLQRPEEFFYNEEAKKYTKKLLRYIVARWGYSTNLFAWELFNEVQFTGSHPNQSARWRQAVLDWHDEMGKEIKSLDAFNHIVTTSAADDQLLQMDKLEGLDVLQYHVYHPNLINTILAKNNDFKSKLMQKSIICGEYGLDVNTANTPVDVQRVLIWAGIFTHVPHLMWLWDDYVKPEWGQLFRYPAEFLKDKDLVGEKNLKTWNFVASGALTGLGFSTDKAWYGFIFHNQHLSGITGAGIKPEDLPDGLYTIRYTDILSGVKTSLHKVPLFGPGKSLSLPGFDKGLVFELVYETGITAPIATLEGPVVTGEGKEAVFSGKGSFIPAGITGLVYQWRLIEKPQDSRLELPVSADSEITLVPDVPGRYTLGLALGSSTGLSEEAVMSFAMNAGPVARAGNDRQSKAGESVDLDGSASFDRENDPLTYNWQLLSAPAASRKIFNFQSQAASQLLTDRGGDYVVSLTVFDGYSYSQPDTVRINTEEVLMTGELPFAPDEILAYPNPTAGKVLLNKPPDLGADVKISLSDLSGKLIGFKEIRKEEAGLHENLEFSLSEYGLQEGSYVLYVLSAPYTRSYKLVYRKN